MKMIVFLCVLWMPLLLSGQEKRDEKSVEVQRDGGLVTKKDSWFGKDKAYHFVGSFFLAGAGCWYHDQCYNRGRGQDIRFGMGFSFLLGISKEFWDSHRPKNRFSWKDLAADFLGVCVCGLLLEWI
ncbi:MAG: hypothetical protein ABIL68_02145 [bacterium]